jgi:hypothetical protein
MSETLRRVVEEVAAAIGAKKVRSGENAMKLGRGSEFTSFAFQIRRGLSIMGTFRDRPVNIEFRGGGELEIDLNTADEARFRILRNGFFARMANQFGRTLKTGDEEFDRVHLVKEEGGMSLDPIVADAAFPEAVLALMPFEQLAAKGRILAGIFTYDPEETTADDVTRRLNAMSDLADLLEAAP